MPAKLLPVEEVPGVEDALATGDPVRCARRVREVLSAGADPTEVVRTAALAAARHFAPTLPPPHALLALSASLDLDPRTEPPNLAVIQACALAAGEWRPERLATAPHVVTGDELHLGRSFLAAVRAAEVVEADAIFSGLLREGDERRLAGDVLFEACAQDAAEEGHKLPFAVGAWRLARALGWRDGPVFLRPAVYLAAGTPQDLAGFTDVLREVGRSRLDFEMAARNVAPVEQVARNTYDIALGVGPDRVVADVINGLKRGRAATGYADLIAATAAERLVVDPTALEPALFALAVRFVLAFSRTTSHQLAVLIAARIAATARPEPLPPPARIASPEGALNDLDVAIGAGDPREAVRIALGLVREDQGEALSRRLVRLAALEDAHADGGHRLLYASWATEFASAAPGPAYASLAALLARTPKSRAVSEAL